MSILYVYILTEKVAKANRMKVENGMQVGLFCITSWKFQSIFF